MSKNGNNNPTQKNSTAAVQLEFGKTNWRALLFSFGILILGFVLMASDKQEYGYGILGLTIGPVLVLTGLIIPFFSILRDNSKFSFRFSLQRKFSVSFEKRIHIITGWFLFFVCSVIYFLTAEPTVSFWDCGEFIAASYKLEIPHPPGAPLFLLIGRFFSLFAPGKESVAFCVNAVSVLASAFTISFLYWSIVMLMKKLSKNSEDSKQQIFVTAFIAAAGALTFAFTDTFWFNAEEAEVYALSCFFTAAGFWAILKWDVHADEPTADKWLLFIAYLTGLSIGVHLLNLLTLPALAMSFYFRRNKKTSFKGIIFTLFISAAILLLLMEGVITGLPTLAGKFEVFFINTIHLPFGAGIIIFVLSVITFIFFTLRYAIRKQKKWLRFATLALIYILTGYSSYLIVAIRSGYNPPMDENDPENILNMVLYLNRDQYGSRPLLKGPYFTAGYPEKVIKKAPRHKADAASGRYVIYDHEMEYEYNPQQVGLFPRAYSTEARHKDAYMKWMNLSEGQKPSVMQNLGFMFNYQIGHMYWRYFLWNFAGRESDEQNAPWIGPGDWFQKKDLPQSISKNKSRNNYFCIPLLLGIIGIIFHFRKNRKDAFVVLLLFFFTGIAIVLYLNEPPVEPRERDYTHVGSFYAFSIWISIGLISVINYLSKWLRSKNFKPLMAILSAILLPALMISENWNDHSRAGRYFALDSAKNLLGGCAQNAILFCAADNDTFPLWYAQEVEGYRTDVRVCNLSLLSSDWYISSMKKKCNASFPLPISMREKDYIRGKNDQIIVTENPAFAGGLSLQKYFDLLEKESDDVYYLQPNGDKFTLMPSKKLFLEIDTTNANTFNGIAPQYKKYLLKRMPLLMTNNFYKSELAVLDIIAHNNWERPIYFDNSAVTDYAYLKPYLQNEGNAFRLLPVTIPNEKDGWVNTDIAYKNLTENSFWRNTNDPDINHDLAGMPFIYGARAEHFNVAVQLMREGQKEKAKKLILHSLFVMPDSCYTFDHIVLSYAGILFDLKENKLALEICNTIGNRSKETLMYLSGQKNMRKENSFQYQLYLIQQIARCLRNAGEIKKAEEYEMILEGYGTP